MNILLLRGRKHKNINGIPNGLPNAIIQIKAFPEEPKEWGYSICMEYNELKENCEQLHSGRNKLCVREKQLIKRDKGE